MAARAQLQASLAANITPFSNALKKASAQSKAFASSVGGHLKSFITSPLALAGTAIAGALSVKAFAGGIKGAIMAGDEIWNMHRRTGMAVGSLAMLKTIGAAAGVELESIAMATGKMQKALFMAAKGSKEANFSLQLIGLSIKQIGAESPEKQFYDIGTAIAKLPSAAERTGAAMAIFGRAGAALLPMFDEMSNSGFGELSEKAKVMQANAETFHRITVAFRKAGTNLKSIFLGIAAQITEPLMALANVLKKPEFLKIGQKIGNDLRKGAEFLVGAFQNPKAFLSVFADEFKGVVLDVVADFSDAISGAFGALSGGINSDFMTTAANFMGGLATGALGFAMILEGALMKAFARASSYLQAQMEAAGSAIYATAEETKLSGMKAHRAAQGSWSNFLPGQKEAVAQMDRDIAAQTAKVNGIAAGRTGTGISARANAIFTEGGAQAMGDDMMKAGAKMAKSAGFGTNFVSGIASAITGNTADTRAKASVYKAHAAAAAEALRAKGAETITNAAAVPRKLGAYFDQWARQPAADMQRAYGQTNLLTLHERRAMENAAVAAGETRRGSSAMAFGAVRSGDARRRKNFERERLKREGTTERTNELLGKILGTWQGGEQGA